ncbi:c-type cytochrome [Psychromonas sp. Urea-02u-13]|uniref:c-type cytochrome n=1 Tax=Psychromonas sp. Urea-02u-13 TaxID=2058326 RepID=UPI0012FED721
MLKNITITRFVCLLTLIIPLFASATSLTTLQTCQSCHGLKGEGVKNFTPRLAGLDEKYLDQQINLFNLRSG